MNIKTLQFLLKYSVAKRSAIRSFMEFTKNQTLTSDEINNLNWAKTKKLLDYAYENVPFYKSRFDKIGLNPKEIQFEKHFEQVPILTKQDISEHYDSLISNKFKRNQIRELTTGGSTGKPLRIGKDKKVVREAQKWRIQSWWGIEPTDNLATIYRPLPYSRIEKAIVGLIHWPQRLIKLDATNISKQDIHDFVQKLNRHNPKMIHGYVGAVEHLADYILDHSIKVHSPEVVWLTAAPTSKIQENKISKAFNSPICDQYGCTEIYYVAAECPKKEGLHILADVVKVETINVSDTSNYGDLIITDLQDFAFPLIRYQNGDRAKLSSSKCSCGLNLPLMSKVSGRISDNLILSNGVVLSGEYLTTIFDNYVDSVKQFQIEQKGDQITIRVVKRNVDNIVDVEANVRNEILQKSKGIAKVVIEHKEEIANPNGKIKFITKK